MYYTWKEQQCINSCVLTSFSWREWLLRSMWFYLLEMRMQFGGLVDKILIMWNTRLKIIKRKQFSIFREIHEQKKSLKNCTKLVFLITKNMLLLRNEFRKEDRYPKEKSFMNSILLLRLRVPFSLIRHFCVPPSTLRGDIGAKSRDTHTRIFF